MKLLTLRPSHARGFTLVMTLTILAAVTLLVVGLFSIASGEKQTSASFDAVEQADLAVQAGLAKASAMLDEVTQGDDAVIFAKPLSPATDTLGRPREQLVAARYDASQAMWLYQPLFSGAKTPLAATTTPTPSTKMLMDLDADGNADAPEPAVTPKAEELAALQSYPKTLSWKARPAAFWEYLSYPTTDADGTVTETITARYCFSIEDLQANVSLRDAGNVEGSGDMHERISLAQAGTANVPFVPGLNTVEVTTNKPPLNQIALYAIPYPNAEQDAGTMTLDNWLAEARHLHFSPGGWHELLISEGQSPDDFKRDASGFLTGTQVKLLEPSVAADIQPYDELALIPATAGIAGAGGRKLNLNKMLQDIVTDPAARATKVDEIASHIETHLTGANGHGFKERAGGYTLGATPSDKQLNYLKCLAAGMIDYADEDSLPTLTEGAYRGMDAFPLVNELMAAFRVEKLATNEVIFTITLYVELWNMTNKVVACEVQAAFDYNATAKLGFQDIAPEMRLDLITAASDRPVADAGMLWLAPRSISLQPNQFTVVPFTTLRYTVPVTSKPANVVVSADNTSRYALRFKPTGAAAFTLVDKPLSFVERKSRTVSVNNQAVSANNAAGAYGDGPYEEGMGDPRGAFFIKHSQVSDDFQSAVAYDSGASPGGRNFRANIAASDYAGREAKPSIWPDGGHDSPPGNKPSSQNTNPNTVALAAHQPDKFIQILSNAGRFHSVTELGNIFDPVMWKPAGYGNSYSTIPLFTDLKPGATTTAHSAYCGGQTLRIGRPEHSRWRPDLNTTPYTPNPASARPHDRRDSASALLDLFHCGMPFESDLVKLTGDLIRIQGHVNLNTASRDALRAVLAGKLGADPAILPVSTNFHPARSATADRPADATTAAADLFADLIIKHRPFATPAELTDKLMRVTGKLADGTPKTDDVPLLGTKDGAPSSTGAKATEWNDAAAEELFARLFNSTTVRSRNFRIVVTGQTIRPVASRQTGTTTARVLATRSRLYHVFVEPVRAADGTITSQKVKVTHARTL